MAVRAARMIIDEEYLNLTGVHCHIGSDISSPKPFEIAATTMLEIVYNIKEMGVEIEALNLGGGLVLITYTMIQFSMLKNTYIQ